MKSPSGKRASLSREPATKCSSGMRLKRNVFAGLAIRKLLTTSLNGTEGKTETESNQPGREGLRKYLINDVPKLYHKQVTEVTTYTNFPAGQHCDAILSDKTAAGFLSPYSCMHLSFRKSTSFLVSTCTCVLPKS